MPERRAYKTDESFLEKLAIGASGTRFVCQDLQRHGHRPVELERGSQSFKLWKEIKIKRLRVPDLLCTACRHPLRVAGQDQAQDFHVAFHDQSRAGMGLRHARHRPGGSGGMQPDR